MDSNYGEFQGTDLDPSADWDFDDDFDDEGNDLLPILGASVLLAAVVGGVLVGVGRRRNPTPEERIQEVIAQMEKRGKKGAVQLEKRGRQTLKAAQHAVGNGRLGDLLDDAIVYTRHRAEDAGKALDDSKLRDTLDDAITRARKAASRVDVQETASDVSDSVRKSVKKGVKQARREMRDLALGDAVESALARARKSAGSVDVGYIAKDVRKRAEGVVDSVRDSDIDAGGALGSLRDRVSAMVDTVREDLAPRAVDVAQDAVGRMREDVIPSAQKRVSKLVDDTELDKKASEAAKQARHGAESFGDVMRGVGAAVLTRVVDELLPQARKAGNRAVETAREDVIPAVADKAGGAAQKLRDDVLPRVGEFAEKTPDMLGDLLSMARERADDLIEKAQPVAADAIEFGRHRAGDFAEFSRHRAGDIADAVRDNKGGVSDAVSSAGHGVKGAVSSVGGGISGGISSAGKGVKGAVGATTHATRELGAIFFWLSMLGGLILLAFVPDKEKQQEIWNSVRQFLGELREMWRDLQGEDYELEAPDTEV